MIFPQKRCKYNKTKYRNAALQPQMTTVLGLLLFSENKLKYFCFNMTIQKFFSSMHMAFDFCFVVFLVCICKAAIVIQMKITFLNLLGFVCLQMFI